MGLSRRLAIVLTAIGLALAGCGGNDSASTRDVVTIAAFGFSESRVLAELYGQALEAEGIPVERAFDLASREVVEPALEQGVVDFVPEYSGTALAFVTRGAGEVTADPAVTHRLLRETMAARGVTALDPAPAQNQNAIAVTSDTAARLELANVSDLGPVAGTLRFGGPPECPERRFCLGGLRNVYGLNFKEFVPLDAAGPLTAGALEGAEVDVGLMFTTSPVVSDKNLVLLRDDKQLQPAENVTPVVRTAVVDRYGERLRNAVNAVSSLLTTEELVRLNHSVEVAGGAPVEAVRTWLQGHGLGTR
ncbi:MAG TPA: ABC transporter substrate-binding protein [Acidimicrobiales bacterium]|nr:ABC transporter substrate-binding protein [Acidimicrobiales bacterium]